MNEIINKSDGTILNWTRTPDNNYFCLLYNDKSNNYSFTPTTNLNCKLFMIGGGGAGGYYFGGGGGAGAAYYNEKFIFKKGITYNFTIGTAGSCDIVNFDQLFTEGLKLNIYNNVNIDFNKISFTHDDYSSLNIDSTGLIQSFIVNNYNTDTAININIPNTIWNNNTFYIWSGYILPTNNDGYIKINIRTNIKTAIWFDNYIYTNDNALVLNTNDNILKEVKFFLNVSQQRYYNLKIIAYCDNNSISNNFNITFSQNCKVYNFNRNSENYIYLNASATTLNYNDPYIDNPINNLICNGGGNGGCGFFNHNNNLDGGCGGGSGINKVKGNSIINKSIYKGTDGSIGEFCGGGGGIVSSGNDKIGGDGLILNWFNNELFFGCGGNGGNYIDKRNRGYGCGGNGGDCCYFSKDLINNNGMNGCVIIYMNNFESFTDYDNEIDYNYITDVNKKLKVTQIYLNSIKTITDYSVNGQYGFNVDSPLFDSTGTSVNTYTGYNEPNVHNDLHNNNAKVTDNATFPLISNTNAIYGNYNSGKDGVDKFYNYFKYNPIYIYDILCLHKCIIALYKILYYQINNNPYDTTFYDNLQINLTEKTEINSTNYSRGTSIINLNNIFKINSTVFNYQDSTDDAKKTHYCSKFYGSTTENDNQSLYMSTDIYNSDPDNLNILPYYTLQNNSSQFTGLTYIKDYLLYDFTNTKKIRDGNNGYIRTPDFIKGLFTGGKSTININNVRTAIKKIINDMKTNSNEIDITYSLHDKEIQLLYLNIFNDVLDKNSMSTICGKLYFYAHKFNLIILNLNLQYGLYRLLFSRLYYIPYISYGSTPTVQYFTNTGTGVLRNLITCNNDEINTTTYNNNIDDTIKIISYVDKKIKLFYQTKTQNNDIVALGEDNYKISNTLKVSQLKLNKIIKKYNDELQVYNTTINIYKTIIVLSIILLILIIYIFSLNSNILNNTSKIIIFITLSIILLLITLYFIYNNNIIYENFENNKSNDIIETFVDSNCNTPTVRNENKYIRFHINNCKRFIPSSTQVKDNNVDLYNYFENNANNFNNYKYNYQGYITNYYYLSVFLSDITLATTDTNSYLINFNNRISFNSYNTISIGFYDYLRLSIVSTFNIINNSNNINDENNKIISYKNKRNNFYNNRREYYINSIESLKNNKYIYYYLSILYALCIILLLFSLIMILIFGHSFNSIIITLIISFLIVLIIIYYIYFKLHQRTRLKIDKNYWSYVNPSDETLKSSI